MIDLSYERGPFTATVCSDEENFRLLTAAIWCGESEVDSKRFTDLEDAADWLYGTLEELRDDLVHLISRIEGV